jgi:hypothetical protein
MAAEASSRLTLLGFGAGQGGERIVSVPSEVSHMALGFQGVGYNDDDMIYYHCLHMMLGGGASFSAGGPGKGLYSRLYANVLNAYPWVQVHSSLIPVFRYSGDKKSTTEEHCVQTATAFSVQYEDTGFFGIMGAAEGEAMGQLTSVLCKEMETAASKPIPDGLCHPPAFMCPQELHSKSTFLVQFSTGVGHFDALPGGFRPEQWSWRG